MNNVATKNQTNEILLSEILPTPTKETIENRYSTQQSPAGCVHSNCFGYTGS